MNAKLNVSRFELMGMSVFFYLTLIFPSCINAAPAISNTSGDLSQNSSMSVMGSGFGQHALNIESLQSNIESGTIGAEFSKTGWYHSEWSAYADPIYANDSAHSGGKSIKCSMTSTNMQYNCAFAYRVADVQAGGRLYATWWVKYDGETAGQWKMLRVSSESTIVDGVHNANMYHHFDTQRQIVVNHGYTEQRSLWPGKDHFPKGDNTWHRVEMDYKASDTATPNGVMTVRTTTDSGSIGYRTWTDVNTHPLAENAWKYLIWQNYIGNGITRATVWLDDLYIQTGTPSRVELCSGSTWENRGKCEIQLPTSWQENQISVQVNTGNFQSGSEVYLYIVDHGGTANNSGYKMAIDSNSSPVIVPAPTLNSINAQ